MTPLSKWLPANWKDGANAKKKDDSVGMPLVVTTEPVIYRNFIQGAGNHGIGVGYPGNMNIAWNAETMNLAVIWRGAFIDAARHWRDRGGGHQPPLGYDIVKPSGEAGLPFATLADPNAEWPQAARHQRAEGCQFKGYKLDARRFPTFEYTWNGMRVTDRFDVQGDALSDQGKLTRTLQLSGNLPPGTLFRIATGSGIQAEGSAFVIDQTTKMVVTAVGAQLSGKNLIVPVRPEINVTYSWPSGHIHHANAHTH